MNTAVSIPTTLTERLELDTEALRFPASFDEFVALLEKVEYPIEYSKGKKAYTNPWLVSEVISPSSRNRDFGEKLRGYKSLPGLKYILYIEQEQPFVTLFEHIPGTHRWKSTDYDSSEQLLEIGEIKFKVSDLYVQV